MKRIPHIVLAFDTSRGWGRDILQGVAAFTERHGPWDCNFSVFGALNPRDARRVNAADGVIAGMQTPEAIAAAKKLKVPVVSIGIDSTPNAANVYSDPVSIGRMAANHFVERGFRLFGYCQFEGSLTSRRRREEFVRAIEALGYHCQLLELDKPRTRMHDPLNHDRLVAQLKKLPKPIGLFCAGDARAREIAMACREAGIAVPGQIAILGVGNDALLCRLCSPQISSIDAAYKTIGFEAARVLKRLLDGHRLPPPIAVPPIRILVRESSDVIAVSDPHVAAAVKFIRHHIRDGVNVKQLMKHIPICRRKLEQAFREHLGRTLHHEIVLAKLHRASWMLVETHQPMTQVAKACGMGHQSRLTHLFKKYTGTSPLRFRKMHQLAEPK